MWTKAKGLSWAITHWVKVQAAAVSWDAAGTQTHKYASTPLQWIAMAKPMSYIGPGEPFPAGDFPSRYIYAIGNPLLWWSACLATVAIVAAVLVRVARNLAARIPTPFQSLPRHTQALLMAALFPVFTFGGFAILGQGPRTLFIFYMTLVVPFFALTLAGALAHLWDLGGRLRCARRLADHAPLRPARHGAAAWRAAPAGAARAVVAAVRFAVQPRVRGAFLRSIAATACVLVLAGFLFYFPVSIYLEIPRSWFKFIMHALPWMQE
jgi:dolichyl-phosphate-mannose--protein O-mannosyl transferase